MEKNQKKHNDPKPMYENVGKESHTGMYGTYIRNILSVFQYFSIQYIVCSILVVCGVKTILQCATHLSPSRQARSQKSKVST